MFCLFVLVATVRSSTCLESLIFAPPTSIYLEQMSVYLKEIHLRIITQATVIECEARQLPGCLFASRPVTLHSAATTVDGPKDRSLEWSVQISMRSQLKAWAHTKPVGVIGGAHIKTTFSLSSDFDQGPELP